MKPPYPKPTSEQVTRRMRRNLRADTRPEVAVRSALHAGGLRFRKHLAIRAGGVLVRPDIVFTKARLAVFIDGCFWHSCPTHGNIPRANNDYWRPKLEQNIRRDSAVNDALEANQWRVVRAWEHEPVESVVGRVVEALKTN